MSTHALAIDTVRYVGDPEAALAYLEERIHAYNRVGNVHSVVALECGDVDEGFYEVEYIREDTFFFQGNTHLPMEPHATVAQYTPDGALTLWSAIQTLYYVRRALG